MRPTEPDPAAIFAAATSIYEAGQEEAARKSINLSDEYSGLDEYMRTCMKLATAFEKWACENIDFDELSEVWPYLLEDTFGQAALKFIGVGDLGMFGGEECSKIATELNLPMRGRHTYSEEEKLAAVIVDQLTPVIACHNGYVGPELFRELTVRLSELMQEDIALKKTLIQVLDLFDAESSKAHPDPVKDGIETIRDLVEGFRGHE